MSDSVSSQENKALKAIKNRGQARFNDVAQALNGEDVNPQDIIEDLKRKVFISVKNVGRVQEYALTKKGLSLFKKIESK